MSGLETNLKSTRSRPPAKGRDRDRDPENWSRDLHHWRKEARGTAPYPHCVPWRKH